MSDTIHIALADDELLFLQGMKALLSKNKDFSIVCTADDGQELYNLIKQTDQRIDIVITDIKMPNLNGIELTKKLREEFPDIKIIALTSYFTKPFIVNMISIGAVGYLAKNSSPAHMIETIKGVNENGFHYSNEVLKYIHEGLSNPKRSNKSIMDEKFFTKREVQVLELLCKEYSNQEIADELFISTRTVEGHRNSLMAKTNVKNSLGLGIFAVKHGIINITD